MAVRPITQVAILAEAAVEEYRISQVALPEVEAGERPPEAVKPDQHRPTGL